MTVRMFFDFDGVLNPIPYREVWIGPENVSYNGFEMLNPKNWTVEELTIDPDLYFLPDHTEQIAVVNEWSGKEKTYTIRWSSELIDRITALVATGKADFTWLTTWRQRAPELLAPLIGIDPTWKHADWQERRSDYAQWGKTEPISEWLGSGATEPFVWIDDVATKEFATDTLPRTAKERKRDPRFGGRFTHPILATTNPSLVLNTSLYFGVSREQWDAVETFVDTNA